MVVSFVDLAANFSLLNELAGYSYTSEKRDYVVLGIEKENNKRKLKTFVSSY